MVKGKNVIYRINGFIVLIGIHLYVLKKLVFFPYPELFVYSYLTKQGLIPYKQIFDQHFPGIMFFPINMISLGIDTPQEARLLQLGVVAVTHILIFSISKKIFKTNFYSLIPNLLYLVWQPFFEGYVLWIDSFIAMFLLLACYFLLRKKNANDILYSGIFLGIALLFKQVVVLLLILIAMFLVVKKKSAFIKFLLGLSVPLILLVLWVTNLGIWSDFIYWTFTFNVTTFAQMGRKYPVLHDILKFAWVLGPAFLAVFAKLRRGFIEDHILLTIFLVGSLAFAYARADFIHIQPALPFAIIMFVLFLSLLSKKLLLAYLTIYFIGSVYLLVPFYRWASAQDNVFFFGETEVRIVKEVRKYSDEDDSVFAFGTTPHLYFLTDTLPPGRVFVFQFPWFMKVAEGKILQGIMDDPPKVVVRDINASVQGMNLVENMPEISRYIDNHYVVRGKVDDTEIMVPN